MGYKSACFIGCGLCLTILCLLVGVNSLLIDSINRRDHNESGEYNDRIDCRLISITTDTSVDESGNGCVYWTYRVLLERDGPQPPGSLPTTPAPSSLTSVLGLTSSPFASPDLRTAYSNFFPRRCGGAFYNASKLNDTINCWQKAGDDRIVRVSPVFERMDMHLWIGSALVSVAILLCILFVVYMCVRCIRSHRAERRREFLEEEMRRRRFEHLGNDEDEDPNAFEIPEVELCNDEWLIAMATQRHHCAPVLRHFALLSDQQLSAARRRRSAMAEETTTVGAEPFDETEEETVDATFHCPVCFEDIVMPFIMFECGHFVCVACFEGLMRMEHEVSGCIGLVVCPTCRGHHLVDQMRRIQQFASMA